jgi:phosphoesterase RecJ-like protein
MMNDFLAKEQVDFFSQLISSANEIVILGHTNPDGDAIGSVVAMSRFLKLSGKSVNVIIPNKYPDYLSFLDENGEILIFSNCKKKSSDLISNCDLLIALDFNQLSRIDDMEGLVRECKAPKILIDHHPSPESDSFDLVISKIETSSNSEILYWLFFSLLGGKISLEVAEPLYVGMMTDTNNFANSVLPSTFRMASDLMEKGVDKERLQYLVFGGFSEARMRLMGYLMSEKMVILYDLEAGYIMLSKYDQNRFGFNEGDSEGFVNIPLSIRGINVSALFTEGDNYVRVSLRSKNDFSVNSMARRFFNGGGHERAAGGKLFIPFDQVENYFTESLKICYDEYKKRE